MAGPSLSTLPEVPVKHADFISYVQSNPSKHMSELLEPYKQYDSKLREIFAQEPDHPALADHHLNVVPVFNGQQHDVKIRARNLEAESAKEKDTYIMALADEERRANGSPAIVQDIKEFQKNFALFCESSLVDLDWSNVVAAGSSVVTCLLPVPEQHNKSKRALRQYYHETIAPASDVDLFIYGLNERDAIKKIVEIEKRIKDSILTETTTVRTKNAVTIASQYPTRHVQIVLRIYKSVAEILTGFDVDCSCAAYDGKQVYASPRALAAYMTQINTIDLSRRSPSYESRLSKYSHRGFEVHWPLMERSRIDPTIFERNFARTLGLARLLVLERLPTKSDRESYTDERRKERGRPAVHRPYFNPFRSGNIKERHEDEVAEWVDAEDVSDYHTFTIPYGPKYHAKKIEKLLYTKDLLLNSEWNKPDDREVNLHRHPAFFGFAEDVITDCCGYCPKPSTPEEHDVADEEAKIYVSGPISFIKDDPGRQAIGSFNPITDDDWTEMAYVGNTTRLCQAIVDGDLEHVEDWLAQEGSDPNTRDYTGRTPLHLAVVSSTPEIVQSLINHGARLVARLADGRTALHLAAARGSVEIVRMIMQKSEENEEEETRKEDARKKARMAAREGKTEPTKEVKAPASHDEDGSDMEVIDEDDVSETDAHSMATGSFVKVKDDDKKKIEEVLPEENDDEPDFYDVNVLAWDTNCSPLHLAIISGHVEVVKELVQNFGADVLLPIKLLNTYDRSPRGAILTLVLSLELPLDKAKAMTKALLELGASSAQADMNQTTAFHHISGKEKPEILDILLQHDEPAAKRALNHLSVSGTTWNPNAQSALMTAIANKDPIAALKLLEVGADPTIDFKSWIKSVEARFEEVSKRDPETNQNDFNRDIEQPIILAVQNELPDVAIQLLALGVDPNTLTKQARQVFGPSSYYWRRHGLESLLDLVKNKVKRLEEYKDDQPPQKPALKVEEGFDYLKGLEPGTYKYFVAKVQLEQAKKSDQSSMESYENSLKAHNEREGVAEKQAAIDALLIEFKKLEQELLSKDAKTFEQLYPDIKQEEQSDHYALPLYQAQHNPLEIYYSFRVHNLTEELREAYLKLFQAAWDGDLETIKSLTLSPWGPDNSPPLKIAVQDSYWLSPFHSAVLRGHHHVARAIVEIAFAQYQPDDEKPKTRYRMNEEREYDSDEESTSSSSDVGVHQEIVDDKFIIDNVGDVSDQVKSTVSPSAMLHWAAPNGYFARYILDNKTYPFGINNREYVPEGDHDLITWSIVTNDKALFAFMLDLKLEWADKESEGSGKLAGAPSFSFYQFQTAIKYGRLELLAELIKHGGAGLELESLVKSSGVKYKEKPKYYEGLSVHGKKRPAWVSAARGEYTRGVAETTPPLLEAARNGSLQSVEWFLSDTPARHYEDYAEAYKHDNLIAHLNTAGGGFNQVMRKWLGARRELALHCAVLAPDGEETLKLIEYLIKAMPDSLEHKSRDGYTPLALAFSLRRVEAAKILIAAGADQTVRDKNGANILHLFLRSAYYNQVPEKHHITEFLELIDTRLVPSLLNERVAHHPGSLTPLASWVYLASPSTENDEILRMLLDFGKRTNNEHLELLDGSGDTPVHNVVKAKQLSWLKLMLEYRPDLLYRENSVGRTPYELAEDAFISESVSDSSSTRRRYSADGQLVDRGVWEFDPNNDQSAQNKDVIWLTCDELAKRNPGKRRLVSLLDANEVANRLAERNKRKYVYNIDSNDSDAGSDDGNEQYQDEVQKFY